jgi:ERCC4-type nuclease
MQQQSTPLQFVRRIAVDDRERDHRVKNALARIDNVEIAIKRLPLGDYQIEDSLIVGWVPRITM